MKHTNTIAFLGLIASFSSAQAALTAGSSVTVDFDAVTDLNDFTDNRFTTQDNPDVPGPGLGSAHSVAGGTSASGAIVATNVGTTNSQNDFASLYTPGGAGSTDGSIILGVGESVTMSVDFLTSSVASGATPRFGLTSFLDTAALTTNWTVFDNATGKDIIGNGVSSGMSMNTATPANKTFNIVDSQPGNGNKTSFPDPNGPYDLSDAVWYQYQLNIIKTATPGDFDVSIELNELDASGGFSAAVGSHSDTINNVDFYNEIGNDGALVGFTFVADGTGSSVTSTYDNLNITVTGVPEPSSTALLGLGGLALLRRRR